MELNETDISLEAFDERMRRALDARRKDWRWPRWTPVQVSDKPLSLDVWLADNIEGRWINDLEGILRGGPDLR